MLHFRPEKSMTALMEFHKPAVNSALRDSCTEREVNKVWAIVELVTYAGVFGKRT